MKRLKLFVASLGLLLCLAPAAVPAGTAYAADPLDKACTNAAAKASPVCKTTGNDPLGGRNGLLYRAAMVVAAVSAAAAVIVIIISGFRYVTAGDDSNKATSARKAIIAAVIGLVVIALAQTVIAFVISGVR
ncbi:MAG TPA: hypothetical protein VJ836_07155 [Candidatus Saccharimonadales bacterium]|nr:hypothetical protein [Candidatus Saccharimonadales bacterium]